jgi:hypothetical protein
LLRHSRHTPLLDEIEKNQARTWRLEGGETGCLRIS